MPLDPDIADILERIKRAGHPAFWQLDVAAARLAYARGAPILDINRLPMARVEDFTIAAPDDSALAVRLYVPSDAERHAGLFVHFHGGGFTVGDLDTHDRLCRMYARRSDVLVLAVDYRRAPEHRFPSAVLDAFAALRWAAANAARLGVAPERLGVVGDSAGGTLATVAALLARDAAMPLVLQVLVYPGTARAPTRPSHVRNAEGFLLDARTIDWFFGNYLRSEADRDDWRFAPLDGAGRPPLAGVAPACVVVAGYDPLYDDGVEYARALEEAGVPVTLLDYPGMVHGFFQFGGAVAGARRAHTEVVAVMRAALGLPAEAPHGA